MTTFPTINLNGSSPEGLLDQLSKANNAISDLKWALRNAAPHGRDYPGDPANWAAADYEHRRRLAVIEGVQDELNEIAENIVKQQADWRKP